MKKQEREHLKADPFQEFIEKTLEILKKLKKPILIGVGVVAVIVIVTLVISLFRNHAIKADNKIFAEALMIQQSPNTPLDEKIKKLESLEVRGGVSATVKLTLVSLYYEKGDYAKAQETLDKFAGGDNRLLDDKKNLLAAEVALASGKHKEATDKISALVNDGECQIAKDFLLFRLAQIQLKNTDKTLAVNSLKKLNEEYPQSAYRGEAQTLLEKLEK